MYSAMWPSRYPPFKVMQVDEFQVDDHGMFHLQVSEIPCEFIEVELVIDDQEGGPNHGEEDSIVAGP